MNTIGQRWRRPFGRHGCLCPIRLLPAAQRGGGDIYLVDAVRTPFGRAGQKGVYANTRADDLAAKAVVGLMERNKQVPPERIDDVAIAATNQQGDQGLTLGRTTAILAGLPITVPGLAIDRMCSGAMTSVALMAGSIGLGMYDLALAGGVEHMGHHPVRFDDLNPRFSGESLIDSDAFNMGITAERLHDTFPQLTRERADRYGLRSQQKAEAAYAAGKFQPDLIPVAVTDLDGASGLATEDEGRRPGTTLEGLAAPQDTVSAARPGQRRYRLAVDRRCDHQPARRHRRDRRIRIVTEDAAGLLRFHRGAA